MDGAHMGPNMAMPISVPANGRGRRGASSVEEEDKAFLRAVSRAFLNAVNTEDRANAVLYSRAMLAIMNRGPG
jgi:hypothetical protein